MQKLYIFLLVALVVLPTARADWPQFRGPDGQGVARDAKIPLSWSESENVSWAVPIPGKGWSSPIVQGNRIWLTTAVTSEPTEEQIKKQFEKSTLDEKQFVRRQVAGTVSLRVMCLDRVSGSIEHDLEFNKVESPEAIHIGNSYASPTPIIEGNRLYVHFGIDGTACIDTKSGKVLWRRAVEVFYSVGVGSSPVLYKDLLILICDGVDKQFIIALDKKTGEPVWRTDRPPIRAPDGQQKKAYSTPLVISHDGRDQLICPGSQWFISYDPLTGKEIWRADHGSGFSLIPRPVFGHGMVYLCTGYGRPELWAIRVDGEGDVTKTHVEWTAKSQISNNPSPLLVDDLIFVISDKGIASCLDAKTGETHWKERVGGNHSASPVFANGVVYFFNHDGETTAVKASKEFESLATNKIEGQLMASPAVLKNQLLLRSDSKLYCIE